jgi:hypothetical protein
MADLSCQSLSQEMFCNNSSGNLDRGGAYRGRVDDTVPRLSLLIVAFPKIREPS